MIKLLAATGNAGKLREFDRILSPLGIEVISPAMAGVAAQAEETGHTFAENAYIKAMEMFKKTGLPSVADDSGLCVDALDGAPGVYSARYGGAEAPYTVKNAALLEELREVPPEKRTARFHCAICCIWDKNTVLRAEETCEGVIGYEPSGSGGFGYDPIFYVGNVSFAALDGEEKDTISHRGKVLRKFAEILSRQMENKETI